VTRDALPALAAVGAGPHLALGRAERQSRSARVVVGRQRLSVDGEPRDELLPLLRHWTLLLQLPLSLQPERTLV